MLGFQMTVRLMTKRSWALNLQTPSFQENIVFYLTKGKCSLNKGNDH